MPAWNSISRGFGGGSGDAPLTVQFDGSTSSDPDGDTLSVAWTVSGPGTCSIGDAALLSTTVTCDTEGVYTLTLTVNDGQNPAVSASTTFVVTTPILPPTL